MEGWHTCALAALDATLIGTDQDLIRNEQVRAAYLAM